jgi:tryptophanyl-tRNA synthetase
MQQALTGRAMADIVSGYSGKGYGDLKSDTADIVMEAITPIRERTRALLADRAELLRLMSRGAERARATASTTLRDVYDKVGFIQV